MFRRNRPSRFIFLSICWDMNSMVENKAISLNFFKMKKSPAFRKRNGAFRVNILPNQTSFWLEMSLSMLISLIYQFFPYSFSLQLHVWTHQRTSRVRHSKWILDHSKCTKISNKEGIRVGFHIRGFPFFWYLIKIFENVGDGIGNMFENIAGYEKWSKTKGSHKKWKTPKKWKISFG